MSEPHRFPDGEPFGMAERHSGAKTVLALRGELDFGSDRDGLSGRAGVRLRF